MANSNYKSIPTPEFRLCFPNFFEPSSYEGSSKETYNCVMVFPKGTDLSALKALAEEAFNAKFPKGAKGARNPFRDGNEKVDDWGEVFRDATYIRASTTRRPVVANRRKAIITDPEEVYSGCYARAVVNCFAYDTAGNKGVSFGLTAVQIVRDGDPLGGGGLAALNLLEDLGDDDTAFGEDNSVKEDNTTGGGLFD